LFRGRRGAGGSSRSTEARQGPSADRGGAELRIYFLQHWFNLSDPAVEEALYDSHAMRRFVGIDLGCEPLPNLSPQRKKERTLEALIRQFEGLAHEKPVVTVWEDAHWLDPTSQELPTSPSSMSAAGRCC
jgi:hypothetical protein